MSERVQQHVPRPSTAEEYLAICHQLIDTAGRPLARQGVVCGMQLRPLHRRAVLVRVALPQLRLNSQRCHRPSGHEAAGWHQSRVIALDNLSTAREAAGYPQVARWPDEGPPHAEQPALPLS